MKKYSQTGFTLVEMVVALGITAVLLGIGVPSFMSAVKNSRLNSHYGSIVGTLYLARSEAVKQNSNVSVCARETDTKCGSEWKNGWITFIDNPGVGTTPGKIDSVDTILQIQSKLGGDSTTITNLGWRKNTASASAQDYIRYRSSGASNWTGGTFVICDDRLEEHAQALNIVLTGDIRKSRSCKDFQNNDLDC